MSLKEYRSITPSSRFTVRVNKKDFVSTTSEPYKPLCFGIKKTGGRNNLGRITSRHIGGGSKKLYRVIDFKRKKLDVFATVEKIEYDPNRTSFIALIKYEDDNSFSYILCPKGIKLGDRIVSSESADIKVGNAMPLKEIPIGTQVHNIEMKPGKGGQISRSAGSFAQLVGKSLGYAQLKLSSGELRLISLSCFATIGLLSNEEHQNIKIGKAGANAWRGKRPKVRGVAMNPVDHPHGGGEGKTSGGRHPVTPWGKSTKGKKTRKNKFTSKFIVKRKN